MSKHTGTDTPAKSARDSEVLNAERRLRIIRRHVRKKGNLLDISFGKSAFAEVAQSKGWQVVSLTLPTGKMRDIRVQVSAVDNENFDVVTMWDMLQRLPEPVEDLQELTANLKTRGLLMLSTPNAAFWGAKSQENETAETPSSTGLHSYDRSTLTAALEEAGFERVAVIRSLPKPRFPDWVENKEHGNDPPSAGKRPKRVLRFAGWVSNIVQRPDEDPFTTLEAVAYKG